MTRHDMYKLYTLCLDINGLEKRNRDIGDLPTVFFEFMGHCAMFEIRVYEKGWMGFSNADKKFEFDVTEPIDEKYEEALNYLRKLRGRLRQ